MSQLQSFVGAVKVFFWFIGTAVLSVWYVFGDPSFDHRTLVIGVLLPDLIDGVWGGSRGMHSVTMSVTVLIVVMLSTIGRRPLRKRLLAIPIGLFLHLIFDGAFNNTQVFWWPVTGLSFADKSLPMVDRGLSNIAFELVGFVLCIFAWKKFHLGDAGRRRAYFKTGELTSVDVPPGGRR